MPTPVSAATAIPRSARALAFLASLLLIAGTAFADDRPARSAAKPAATDAPSMERFFEAVVKVRTRAVPNARSAATLGQEREGTGIVIGDDGLILTIGYLIVEADDVQIVDGRGRTLPAQVAGYDHATGFGLVRTDGPAQGAAAPARRIGQARRARSGARSSTTTARAMSRSPRSYRKRPFTGSWEYLLDQAIFTSPPTANWSGAALVNRDLKLVGVGSLIVREVDADDAAVPGNMFVPIDALKPILADLAKTGQRAGPARPWLGVAADEVQGRLVVARVSPEGPGDKAGIHAGDIILGVGGEGVRTQAEFYRKVWGRGGAGADIPLRVLQGIDVREITVHSIDRVEYFRPRTTY